MATLTFTPSYARSPLAPSTHETKTTPVMLSTTNLLGSPHCDEGMMLVTVVPSHWTTPPEKHAAYTIPVAVFTATSHAKGQSASLSMTETLVPLYDITLLRTHTT